MIEFIKSNIIVNKINSYQTNTYSICWEGFIYIEGYHNGIDSIKYFVQLFDKHDIQSIIHLLEGYFFISLFNKQANKIYSFVDNAGLYKAYYTDDYVSTSLLELVKILKLKTEDFNVHSLIEFFHLGLVYNNKTLFTKIKTIDSKDIILFENDVLKIIKKGKIKLKIKKGNGICFLEDRIKYLIGAVKNEKISIDLTGGMDSRVLVSIINKFTTDYEVAISGVEGNKDIKIALKVAKALNKELFVTYHSIDNLEEEILDLFILSDATMSQLNYHRLAQFQNERKKRGVTLMFSGAAGEIIGDAFWYQEFPFFNRKRTNLNKLIELRFLPFKLHHNYLHQRFKAISKELKSNILKILETYILKNNTQTIDNIFLNYKYKSVIGYILKCNNSILKSYSPYMSLNISNLGFSLKRRQRIFNLYHGKIVSKLNIEIAKIISTRGTNFYFKNIFFIINIFRFILNKIPVLFNKIVQKLFNKDIINESPTNPELFVEVKKLKLTVELIDILKKKEFLVNDLDVKQIPSNYLGNIINLGLLVKYITQDYTLN